MNDYYARLSSRCLHADRTVCHDCAYQNLLFVLEYNIRSAVICPELNCHARLNVEEIRDILLYYDNTDLLERYDIYLTNLLLEGMDEFVWCAYGCGSGQLHLIDSNKVDCIHCDRSTCFQHHIPWHEGVTCEEYDRLDLSNDPMSKKYLKTFSKQCPKCRVKIEKIDGCDHMTCVRCEAEFCWYCLVEFGSAITLDGCKHKRNCIHFEQPFSEYRWRRHRRFSRVSNVCSIS